MHQFFSFIFLSGWPKVDRARKTSAVASLPASRCSHIPHMLQLSYLISFTFLSFQGSLSSLKQSRNNEIECHHFVFNSILLNIFCKGMHNTLVLPCPYALNHKWAFCDFCLYKRRKIYPATDITYSPSSHDLYLTKNLHSQMHQKFLALW